MSLPNSGKRWLNQADKVLHDIAPLKLVVRQFKRMEDQIFYSYLIKGCLLFFYLSG